MSDNRRHASDLCAAIAWYRHTGQESLDRIEGALNAAERRGWRAYEDSYQEERKQWMNKIAEQRAQLQRAEAVVEAGRQVIAGLTADFVDIEPNTRALREALRAFDAEKKEGGSQ